MNEKLYWLSFSVFSGVGPSRFKVILKHFGSAKDAWRAPLADFRKILGEKLGAEFEKFRNDFSPFDYDKKLKEKKVWFLTLEDKNYPKLLAQIPNPPFVLYGKGEIRSFSAEVVSKNFRVHSAGTFFSSDRNFDDAKVHNENFENSPRLIAIVGTRRTTHYGREVTRLLTAELVSAGFTIVSGLAIGIDAISHKTAIENNGKTIAVLGCGVDCCFPRENMGLYKQIVDNGNAIVSELPLSHPPNKGSFPQRNRIIAGLSQAVLVTEGAEDSGSLITADFAFKFNRKVFAVPGPITSSLSKGPFKLINKGAKLITEAGDILKELKISAFAKVSADKQKSKSTKCKTDNKEEERVLKVLENEELHFDEIARKTGISPSLLGSILSMMEVKGFIQDSGGVFKIN